MQPAKNHRFTAAFFDVFIIGSIVQAVGCILISITSPRLAGFLALVSGSGYLLWILVYHLFFAKNSKFCTLGETISGCRIEPEGKSWFTLYDRSRWFLFLTLFLLLLIPANAFDEFQRAQNYPIAMILGRTMFVCIFLWSIYLIALGYFRWSIAIFILLAPRLIGAISHFKTTESELAVANIVIILMIAVCLSITFIMYRKRFEYFENFRIE